MYSDKYQTLQPTEWGLTSYIYIEKYHDERGRDIRIHSGKMLGKRNSVVTLHARVVFDLWKKGIQQGFILRRLYKNNKYRTAWKTEKVCIRRKTKARNSSSFTCRHSVLLNYIFAVSWQLILLGTCISDN